MTPGTETPQSYAELLMHVQPRSITSEEEAAHIQRQIDQLIDRPERTADEEALLSLLGDLVHAWEAGHYESNGSRDWIAIGPGSNSTDRATTLAHKYHHLVAERAGMRLPPWLGEGLAEFFSTLKPSGDKTQAGALIPARLESLKRGRWLSIDALTAVDEKAFSALRADDAGLFYAESWS